MLGSSPISFASVPNAACEDTPPLDPFEFVRTIAIACITMPKTIVRLATGREQLDDAMQALCFLAGASSMFYGDQLLTISNSQMQRDHLLLERLGIRATSVDAQSAQT